MRIEQLDLVCFGPFDGTSLHFERAADGCDLQIIYGPNEAGKSSLRAAFGQLLYGMPRQSKHAFGRDYKLLEIAATLQSDGRMQRVRRLKNALLDGNGERLDERAIDLHGIGEDAYEARFSFDDRILSEGGKAIIAQQGELGAALFSAAAGVSDASARLAEASVEADAFYDWSRRRKQPIDTLIAELAELDERIVAADVALPAWQALDSAREAADAQEQRRRDTRQQITRELNTLRTRREAVREARRVNKLMRELDSFGEAPDLPLETLDRFRDDRSATLEASAQLAPLQGQLQELEARLAALAPDPAALGEAGTIERLRADVSRLAKGHELALQQAARVAQLDKRIDELRLTVRPDDPDIVSQPPAGVLDALDALAGEHGELVRRVASSQREFDRLAGVGTTVTDAGEPPTDDELDARIRRLAATLESIDQRSLLTRLDDERMASSDADTRWRSRLEALAPWREASESLEHLAVPGPARLASLSARVEDIARRRHTLRDRLQAARDNEAMLVTERASLASSGAVPGDAIHDARRSRDAAAESLAAAIADPHEDQAGKRLDELLPLVAAADAIADARFANASASERLRALEANLIDAERRRVSDADDAAMLEHDAELLENERQALLSGLGLATLALEDLPAWLTRRDGALQALETVRQTDARYRRRQVEFEQARDDLVAMLAPGDSSPNAYDFAASVQRARHVLESLRERQAAAQRLRHARELADRERRTRADELAEAQQELQASIERWHQRTIGTPLDALPVVAASSRLDAWRDLSEAFDERANLAASLQVHRDAEQHLRELALATTATLGMDAPADGSDGLVRSLDGLSDRLRRAGESHDAIIEVETHIAERQRTAGELEQGSVSAIERIAALANQVGALDDGSLDSLLERAGKAHRVRDELAEAMQALGERLGREPDSDTLASLQADSGPELDERVIALDDERERAETEHELARDAALQSRRALEGLGDDATLQRLQTQREALLEELAQRTEQTLRLRLGRLAIDAGIQRFREANRSTMLRSAREIFAALTQGRFVDLQTRPDEDGEFLVGVTVDGQLLRAEQMSEGTAIQLYLALRIAAYEDYATRRQPLPFIVDDVLQSADDSRAGAVLERFAEMAGHGQVICLTHHAHLLDIAREATGGRARVHRLPGPCDPGHAATPV